MTGKENLDIKHNTAGIYWFYNNITKQYYIGQSLDIRKRFMQHMLYMKRKNNYPLYNALNKYGLDNFEFHIVKVIDNEGLTKVEITKLLNELEIKYIEKYNSYNNGYNLTIGGASVTGYKFTEELKKKYSVISTKIQHDGRNIIYVYNVKTKEYSEWPTLKTFLKKYNLTSRHISGKKLVVVDNQWVAARSKEELEEKIKLYPKHSLIGVEGVFKCNLDDENFIKDLNNLSIKEILQKYNITKGTYYNYLRRLNIPNKSSQNKDPRIRCHKEDFVRDYSIMSRDELCKKHNISIRHYYTLYHKYIKSTT